MRTWSGMVDLVVDGEVRGQAHADLAAEERDGRLAWWGQLRGAERYGVCEYERVMLRLPGGRAGTVTNPTTDPTDVYRRVEVEGDGPPPF